MWRFIVIMFRFEDRTTKNVDEFLHIKTVCLLNGGGFIYQQIRNEIKIYICDIIDCWQLYRVT